MTTKPSNTPLADALENLGQERAARAVFTVRQLERELAEVKAAPAERTLTDEQDKWLIWSHEHRGYWPSSRCGYVENVTEAGQFTFAEAKEIVHQGNQGMGGWPEETMLPVGSVYALRLAGKT